MILSIITALIPTALKFVLGFFMKKEKAEQVAERVLVYIKEKVKIAIEKAGKLSRGVRRNSVQADAMRKKLKEEHEREQRGQ